jgi:adenylate cyclase
MEVLQSAAGASDFLMQAVDAVDRIVGFDAIAAVRFQGRKWEVVASKTFGVGHFAVPATLPSNTIMQQVYDLKRTIRHLPGSCDSNYSLQGVEALIASPILDPDGDVIGAIYGVRCGTLLRQLPEISDLEATMVEVIGCGAAAGIAREREQKKALAARVLFEQFFTPQLAAELESDPKMLDGREAEISVLFFDIVRFSGISQRIGSHKTLDWINDVMDRLSVVVLQHDGVVVDYIGDELMAMWGAPKPQADHALKACLAACDLLQCKAAIDSRWLAEVGEPIDFRTGICSGIATVGNIGSSRKFKYGPLGETVNLASRLQGVAKHFGVRQVISSETAAGLMSGSNILCRPLGTVSVVNMEKPVSVFELCEKPCGRFESLASWFSHAIDAIRVGDLMTCKTEVSQLVRHFPDDTATQMLAARLQSGETIDGQCIWRFETK